MTIAPCPLLLRSSKLQWLFASPDLRETLMSCFGHSTFLQHVVADIAEDLKLLNASQGVSTVTIFHDFEHVCFGSDHGPFRLLCNHTAEQRRLVNPVDGSSTGTLKVSVRYITYNLSSSSRASIS